MKKNHILLLISFFTFTLVAYAQPLDPLFTYRSLASGGQAQEAFRVLQNLFNSEKNPKDKARMAFALGVLSYNNGKREIAAQYLGQALALKTNLDDYAQFYLGLIERDNKDWEGAKKHFEFVQNYLPRSVKSAEAEIEFARIARIQEKWAQAYQLMTKIEKKYRGNVEHPAILLDLTEIASALKKHSDLCHYAVKFYSKYPSIALSKGWGSDFSQVKVRDSFIKCPLLRKEREKHLSGLMTAGEFEEVRTELKDWTASLRGEKKSHQEELGHIELIQGQLSLAEAKVKEAIQHFLAAQDLLGKNFTAQMFLARAYSLTDDYPRAVEGYLRGYEMSPRSKLGQKALFQAAFLSYQNRDYDGAARHFEDAAQRSKGKIAWDSRWHLAWIRYLKADYEGALSEFGFLAKDKKFAKTVDLEKINYWRGMSEYKLGNTDQARSFFTALAQEKRMGYYAAAAIARLKVLPPPSAVPTSPASPTQASPDASRPSGALSPAASASSGSNTKSRNPSSENSLEGGGDSGLGVAKDSLKPEAENPSEEEDQSPESQADSPPITSLKNSGLVERFERARDLIELGFEAWARAELREIEKRTTNRNYLQTLIAEYHKAGDFYRSAYIADVAFENQREKDGIEGAQQLWMFAFPQAYLHAVTTSCKKFDIPRSLALGIMRGESGFREEIHSSAGALGLMQLIPPTAKKVAKDLGFPSYSNGMLLTADTNILFGVRYLKRLNKTMANNLPLTIASYNAGPHRVQGWLKDFGSLDMDEFIEHIPYLETRNYVKKVLRNYFVYENLYEKKPSSLDWLARKPTIKYEGPRPTSESWED